MLITGRDNKKECMQTRLYVDNKIGRRKHSHNYVNKTEKILDWMSCGQRPTRNVCDMPYREIMHVGVLYQHPFLRCDPMAAQLGERGRTEKQQSPGGGGKMPLSPKVDRNDVISPNVTNMRTRKRTAYHIHSM